MQKFSYHKKYHYALKYFILAFPLICYCLLFICKDYTNLADFVLMPIDFLGSLASADINSWYFNLLDIIGLLSPLDEVRYDILICYPLYILWVYIFDVILDIFAMVPKLAHKLLYKLGGGIDE